MTLYETTVNDMCEKNSPKQLAEMVLGYRETNSLLRADNEDLRKENETLRTLIAKYSMQLVKPKGE